MSFGLIVESAEKREGGEAAGCARGHIVGEGIRLICTTSFGAKDS